MSRILKSLSDTYEPKNWHLALGENQRDTLILPREAFDAMVETTKTNGESIGEWNGIEHNGVFYMLETDTLDYALRMDAYTCGFYCGIRMNNPYESIFEIDVFDKEIDVPDSEDEHILQEAYLASLKYEEVAKLVKDSILKFEDSHWDIILEHRKIARQMLDEEKRRFDDMKRPIEEFEKEGLSACVCHFATPFCGRSGDMPCIGASGFELLDRGVVPPEDGEPDNGVPFWVIKPDRYSHAYRVYPDEIIPSMIEKHKSINYENENQMPWLLKANY